MSLLATETVRKEYHPNDQAPNTIQKEISNAM